MTVGCASIGIKGGDAYAPVTVYQNDFQNPLWEGYLENNGQLSIDSYDLGLGAGVQLTGVWAVETSGETIAIVSPCEIVCCLAKKMDAYVDKACSCEQCDKDMEQIYKIFLLLHTAQVSVSLLDNIELISAKRKYDKAIELCNLGTCKCNC